MAKRKRVPQKTLICPYCGRTAQLRPTAYVYGEDNLNPEGYLYVCSGYPNFCDAYVGAHEKNMRPKGTLADGSLRNKRIMAHRALDAIWKQGYMTRHGAYIWLQYRLNIREKDMHIGMFSDYLCSETIRECTEFMEVQKKLKRGGKKIATENKVTA